MKKYLKIIIKLAIIGFIFSVSFILIANNLVERVSERVFDDVSLIPKNKVGLLLGANKFASDGRLNLFYKYRIDAAVELYNVGKIDVILASGDNGTESYDEPTAMQEDLIARGVLEKDIYLDYAGFRTLDSIVRSKEVFGQESITIISQEFHNERALYLADNFGIEAVAFNARDVATSVSLRIKAREYLARVKMMLDLFLGVDPKFLGDPVVIQ
jgi:SanA protein